MDMYSVQSSVRIRSAVESAYRTLRPFRETMEALVKEYAGPRYGDDAGKTNKEQYINLMYQAVETYLISMVPTAPKILVSTHHQQLNTFAKHFQLAVNNLLEEINFKDTGRDWVLDGIFGLGICKVHMNDSGQVQTEP